ncbi:hypothetical protein [Chamaesiphon sp.]|uniref:hypothetical protein n=1 Tax=Chamaesiphon sp. TaxID=2814140 RepID=UPI0035947FA5
MHSLVIRILRRVRAHGRGKWVFTPKDFLDLGNRAAVDRVKIAQWIDRPGDRVIRALSWLSKDAARDPNAIDTLRSNTPDLVKADLMKGVDNLRG